MTEYYNYVMFSIMISKNGTPKISLTLPLKHGFGTVLMSIAQHLQAISCP